MNKWQKVLDIINEVQCTDIVMGEEFEIKDSNFNPYKFTIGGLFDCDDHNDRFTLYVLISNKVKIIQKPKKWKPKIDESYFVPAVSVEKMYIGNYWCGDCYDNFRYNNGIVCKTEKEAIEMAKKMLKAIESEGE